MYKHHVASPRPFYTTCTFDDIDHSARITDGSLSVASPDEVQIFGSHMDHIVLMTKQGMTAMPNYVLYARTAFESRRNAG